jgi:P27 family predicted phage terminase small subunit
MTQRKSIEQHKAEGTLRSSRHSKTPLLNGDRTVPSCPEHLSGSARAAWSMLIADLWDAGVLDSSDNSLVVAAAVHYGRAIDAGLDINRRGLYIEEEVGGYNGSEVRIKSTPNPSVAMERASLAEYRQLCDKLGIGPGARAALASLGFKGKRPAQVLPGVGSAPVKLRVVNSG